MEGSISTFSTQSPGKDRESNFIPDFPYISRKFLSDLRFIYTDSEEISTPPSCRLLIGIYKFNENRSTETFRKSQEVGCLKYPLILSGKLILKLRITDRCGNKKGRTLSGPASPPKEPHQIFLRPENEKPRAA